jgi:HEAT repeat protein
MRNKRWMMGGGALLCVAALVMIVPNSRRLVVGTLRGEAMQNGKYVSDWTAQLTSEDEDTRREATNNLGYMGATARSALPDLSRVMCDKDEDPRVRCMASHAIDKIASDVMRHGDHATEILDGLIDAVQDADPYVRMNAASGLRWLGADARKAVPQVMAGIKSKDNDIRVLTFTITIREQMLLTLGSIGSDAKDALDLLEESLEDDEQSVRCTAARALGRLGPHAKHAVPLLVKTADNPREPSAVRGSAREALQLIDPELAAKMAKN